MSFLFNIGKWICELMVPHVEYIRNYSSNIEKLQNDVQRLRAKINGLQQRVHEDERNGRLILDSVGQWRTEAIDKCEKADRFLEEEERHARASCFWGYFPDLYLRHELSLEAKEMADSVVDVDSRCRFEQVSCGPNLPSNGGRNQYEYEDFSSRKETMDNVMASLKDPNIRVIGVYGMPGIGKTMFAKEASHKALDQKLFDSIVLVTVSQASDPVRIQQEIAEKLDLKLEKTIVSSRAMELQHKLRSKKNILIILDDVWNKLELHEIGISFGSDQMGCKILLTSRFQHVVCDDMGAKSFKLELLSDKESNDLFYKTVGDSTRGQDLQLIAEQIIEECACLPIVIVVVATALKNKPCYYWENALQELRLATPMSVGEMDEKVYKSVKLSYDFLANREAKYLLLLCSIHQEDENINVEDLVKYGIGLDLFQGITNLKVARNRVRTLVYNLKASCLLLESFDEMHKSESFVKMHDVIRDVCLSIASQDAHMHFVRDVDELKNYIEKNELVNSVAISLPSVNVNQLPKKLECSQLKLLLIRHVWGESHGTLEEQFFEEMKELRVLSLTHVTIKLTCFSQLQNLQTLCLRSCVVGDIAPIGELKKLKILDLQNSKDILEVPREIGQLTLLRSLVLGGCYMIDHVEPHVISSLKNLEELDMEGSFSRWKAIGVKGDISNASPVELNDLDQLTTLNVYIPDVNSLHRIWIKTNLERYQIIIGDWSDVELWYFHEYEKSTSSKMLKLKLEKSHLVKVHGIENLIKSAKELCLHGFGDLNDVLELDKDGFPQLEYFAFQNNGSAQYIINSSNPCSAFLNLKSMFLKNMMNLEKICQGKLIAGSFGKLKKVSVKECHRIKRLFSFSIAKQFEEIDVWNCGALEEIGSGHESEYESSIANNEASNEAKFCQLSTLKLNGLPKVTRFFWPEVETIFMPESGEGLLNGKVIFSKLMHMKLFGLKVGKLWPDEVNGESFMPNLTKLIVDKCHILNYLLSYDVAKGLKLLEHLEVANCNALEEVIAVKTPWEDMLLPKLQTLELCNLPKLSRFCSECCIEYPSLKKLKISECPQLGDLALIGKLNNLEELDFSDWSSIVKLPQGIERLTQLKTLNLDNCRCLKTIKPNILSKLIHLQELKMFMSPVTWEVEGVVSGEGSNASLAELKTLSQLTNLSLSLPDVSIVPKDLFSDKLDHFYIGIGIFPSRTLYIQNSLWLKLKKSELVRELGLQGLLNRCQFLDLNGFEDENDFLYHLGYRVLFSQLKIVNVTSCARFKHLFPYSFFNSIQIEHLTVEDCEGMEAIFTHERDQDHDYQHPSDGNFNELLSLTLKNLPRLEHFYLEMKTSGISHLSNERSNEEFEISVPFFDRNVHMPRLWSLEMELLGCKQIWHRQPLSNFNELNHLNVSCCHHLKSLMSYSMATSLVSLEQLKVCNCEKIEEVISTSEPGNEESLDLILFPNVEELIIKDLPKLQRFGAINGVKCPSLSSLTLINCLNLTTFVDISTYTLAEHALFGEKVIFSKLKHMELSGLNVGKLWPDEVNGESFMPNLTKLIVDKCHILNYLLSYDVAKGLKLLEHLEVANCNALEEVIAVKTPWEDMLLPKLQTLELCNLPKLSRFCSECCIEYPSLKKLKISECPQLGDLALIGKLNNLEELDFSDWSSIVKLPQGIERLTQLKTLNLDNCRCLKTIKPNILSKLIHLQELTMPKSPVTWEAEGVVNAKGSNASIAELKFLPQLTSLSLSLSDVSIVPKDLFCEKLDHFCISIGISSFRMLYGQNSLGLNLKKSELVREFGLQGLLKRCQELHLNGFEDENDFFYHLGYRELFSQLKIMKVTSCARFKHLFPYSFFNPIQIEHLTVEDCEGMEAIITHERDQDHDYQLPSDGNFNKLLYLTLKNLPRLEQFYLEVKTSVISQPSSEPSDVGFEFSVPFFGRNVHMSRLWRLEMELLGCKQIWHRQPLSKFNELRKLKVSCCHHLKSLMSYSMATSLVSLEQLEVCNCEKMEDVIFTSEPGNEESLDLILFPKVEKLIIKDLPKLQRFSATNGVKCPSLSSLTLINCFDLMAFVDISTHAPVVHTFFGGKVIFPSLVSLEVNQREILNQIFNLEGESSVNSFGMLARLCLGSVLPFEVVQRFQNLRELSLSGFTSEKLFQHQELRAVEENENILPHLKTLVLKELPKLLHMFDEDVHLTKAFSNLKIVDIIRCYQLKSFIPPSMSFQYYLKTLRVTECHGLKNLFASSVVKGLINLKKMSIYGCEGMMEIVGKDEVELVSEIVFQKLETLALHNLPSLKCFYCENSTLTFPNLKKLVVSQCPEMQAFSHGIVNSPILDKVITECNDNDYWEGEISIRGHFYGFKWIDVKEECWENNINDSIRKIFEQRSQFNQL